MVSLLLSQILFPFLANAQDTSIGMKQIRGWNATTSEDVGASNSLLEVTNPAKEAAIVPTQSGQIGINPVSDYVGPLSQYVGGIGTNTELFSTEAQTTQVIFLSFSMLQEVLICLKWLVGHTDWLSEDVKTTTVSDQTEIVTTKIQITAATASSDSGIENIGDIAVTLTPALKTALEDIAKGAVAACNTGKRQDDSLSCLLSHAVQAAQPGPGGAYDLIQGLGNANIDIPAAIEAAYDVVARTMRVVKTQARLRAFWIASVAIDAVATLGAVPFIIRLPKYPQFPTQPLSNLQTTEFTTPTTTQTESSTSWGCASGAPTGTDTPICSHDDCQGQDKRCTEVSFPPSTACQRDFSGSNQGKWRHCKCYDPIKCNFGICNAVVGRTAGHTVLDDQFTSPDSVMLCWKLWNRFLRQAYGNAGFMVCLQPHERVLLNDERNNGAMRLQNTTPDAN
ncbi:hypothetical protein K402DRAFT_67697 [Aulographum hederae CBS 113979]|uniref:Uncharacterized protein n=1 Tax=Aulographum hederae CBS 113979 TaxID=1176131 RepID=A0A6G1H1E7_9PEZI|nr:hypothetical protein K402DRAFT_67697 [Aulographum hederae CBS 113979]